MENMGWVNYTDHRWDELTDGSGYFYEKNFEVVSSEGFNCIRVLYSLSYLSDPNDPSKMDLTQLQCLDEAISWGLKYDLHVMISITGLPGKASTKNINQEKVNINDELFTNPDMADLYEDYMSILVKRYKDIPNRNLSFELLAEPEVPNSDISKYEDVLLPIVKALKNIDSDRILIVNDVARQAPERLAAEGCALSLHNHIFVVNKENMSDIQYDPTWPTNYLPGVFSEDNGTLTFNSSSSFKSGTISIYIKQNGGNFGNIVIEADGKQILEADSNVTGWASGKIPSGTKSITIHLKDSGYIEYSGIKIQQKIGKL